MPVAGEYVLNQGLDHRCDSVVTSVFRNFLCSSEAVCDWLEDWWWADLRFSRIRHWVCSSLFMHSRTTGPEMRGKSRRNSLILSWQTVCSSIRANTPPAMTHREWGNGTSKASKVPLVWEKVPPGAWTPKDGSMKMERERERETALKGWCCICFEFKAEACIQYMSLRTKGWDTKGFRISPFSKSPI